MITIVDYGMGNLGSIKNMFKHVGVDAVIESDIDKISKSSKLILPGVGAFDAAMKKINQSGLKEVLDEKVLKEKVPILGICLGMQLLTKRSDEGLSDGLGWIPAKTISFEDKISRGLKVPHMGWNSVKQSNSTKLLDGFENFKDIRFYFVHSYFVKVEDEKNSILKTNYGLDFDSAIQKDNIMGVQFHPEKSHKFGMMFFQNFSKI